MQVNRLIIASNRLPISVQSTSSGEYAIRASSGGLVSALKSALQNRGDTWIGWPGSGDISYDSTDFESLSDELGYRLKSVCLTSDEVQNYYYGFSNEVLWPLFHDLLYPCQFNPKFWRYYQRVNRKFARTIASEVCGNDFVWVHDYHLMLVARELKLSGHYPPMGFFLHIPFPCKDIFMRLPWRQELLEGFLNYDFIGFQTHRDHQNFLQCASTFLTHYKIEQYNDLIRLTHPGGEVYLGSFPISIDYRDIVLRAGTYDVDVLMSSMKQRFRTPKLILSVDRLDYSKGLLNHLKAYALALERYPELREQISFYQLLVPSRTHVPSYQALKQDFERLVGEINGRLNQNGWLPIHYDYRSLTPPELLATYRLSDIALITPIKDGMNLVAKEYCASQLDNEGVLILSEFAGTASELGDHALMINPFDSEGIARAIFDAYHADPELRRKRMKKLREIIKQHDIFQWLSNYLSAAEQTIRSPRPGLSTWAH